MDDFFTLFTADPFSGHQQQTCVDISVELSGFALIYLTVVIFTVMTRSVCISWVMSTYQNITHFPVLFCHLAI